MADLQPPVDGQGRVPVGREDHSHKYGRSANLRFHDEMHGEDRPMRVRDMVRKPVVRQWVEDGKLYREADARETSKFELFFDLLFVAVIHQLAESAVEDANGLAVGRFILTFYPSWSIWEEARRYANVSGTDDLVHRLWVLIGMGTVLGYSVNANAIELYPHGEEGMAESTRAIHCAVVFWLIIKLSRAIVFLIYAWRLPRFRISQLLGSVSVLIPMLVYLIGIATAAIIVDLMRVDSLLYYIYGRIHHLREVRLARAEGRQADSNNNLMRVVALPKGFRIPVLSGVVHLWSLWATLLYTASPGTFGLSEKYGKAVLGLMIAWALNFMYTVPSEEINDYQHALRRSWLTAVFFNFLHWPLCASLVLASAASSRMVQNDEDLGNVEQQNGVKWYWGAGLGFALIIMAILDMLHANMASWRAVRIPRLVRFGFTVGCGLILILVPLAGSRLSYMQHLGIAVGVTWSALMFNGYGILPARGYTPPHPDAESHAAAGGPSPSDPFADGVSSSTSAHAIGASAGPGGEEHRGQMVSEPVLTGHTGLRSIAAHT